MQMMYFWSQFVYFYNRPLEKGIAYLPTKCFRTQKTSAQQSPATRMPCLSRARLLRYWNFWRIVSSDEMIEHHADSPRRSLHLCQNPQFYFRSLFNWREEVLDCDMMLDFAFWRHWNSSTFLLCSLRPGISSCRDIHEICQAFYRVAAGRVARVNKTCGDKCTWGLHVRKILSG